MSYRFHSIIKHLAWSDLKQWFMVKSLQLLLHSSLSYTFAMSLIRLCILFSEDLTKKFSTVRKVFRNQGNFWQSRKFSTIRKVFYNYGSLPWSVKFSTINKVSLNQAKIFFLIKKLFCKKRLLQANILNLYNT